MVADEKQTATSTSEQVPGRVLGFTVMTVLIVFVAWWLQNQNAQLTQAPAPMTSPQRELAGFRSDAWFLPDDSQLGFVLIPAGAFTMGSNPALDRMAYENERWSATARQGRVELPDYYIGRYEVTVAQYNHYLRNSDSSRGTLSDSPEPGHPVTELTLPEALAYARWLDRQLRESPLTPAPLQAFLQSGGRVTLPTEAEWEKAARGTDGAIFPSGARINKDMANYDGVIVLPVGARQ
ncbi:MAG: formylglycine-generating enzyme family protein, partial [Gammaproteobacteria bacterium]